MKDRPLRALLDAIRRAHAGQPFIPPEIARRLASRVVSQLSNSACEVLALIGDRKGQSNREIAAALPSVERTVKVHVTSILAKLGVADRAQAILTAVNRGILRVD